LRKRKVVKGAVIWRERREKIITQSREKGTPFTGRDSHSSERRVVFL